MAKLGNKIIFYGFNKYYYEDDTMYEKTEANYCPACGRKLTETYDRTMEKNNIIFHPSHYCDGRKYEPRKVISDWKLNFNLGNAIKYLSRAGRKGDKVEDLRKAIQYIEFEIEDIENESSD